jgi:histidine triad (HIT) family protein
VTECLFCRIIERAVAAKILYEDDLALGFEDINPQAPIHVLVVPKRHIASINDVDAAEADLLGHLMLTCTRIAQQKGIAQAGYRLVINTGANSGQTVLHLHLHVLGGRAMRWPPG